MILAFPFTDHGISTLGRNLFDISLVTTAMSPYYVLCPDGYLLSGMASSPGVLQGQ
jgi:hypothetical protein